MIRIALVGKTNTGKTTFFNAATLLNAEISGRAFSTKEPYRGIAYVRTLCVCRELEVSDNPRNSACIDGWRFVPVQIIDLPGLIKEAYLGRGLGTRFLSVVSQADALLHVVDASGSIDDEGNLTAPGIGDPVHDVEDIENELVMWFVRIIKNNRDTILRGLQSEDRLDRVLHGFLAGQKVRREHIGEALRRAQLTGKAFSDWDEADLIRFARQIRALSKPTIFVANKMDLPGSTDNLERLTDTLGTDFVVPCSAEAELALRRAEEKKYIRYTPGGEIFRVFDERSLSEEQLKALDYVDRRVFTHWSGTGIQRALNITTFKLLRMNSVYPVDDEVKLSDKDGRVLPDVFLLPPGSTAEDLAYEIHSDLAKTMIFAIDARTRLRLPKDYALRDRDVIKIVAAGERR